MTKSSVTADCIRDNFIHQNKNKMKRVKQLLFKSWELAKDFYLRMSLRINTLRILYIYRIRANQCMIIFEY